MKECDVEKITKNFRDKIERMFGANLPDYINLLGESIQEVVCIEPGKSTKITESIVKKFWQLFANDLPYSSYQLFRDVVEEGMSIEPDDLSGDYKDYRNFSEGYTSSNPAAEKPPTPPKGWVIDGKEKRPPLKGENYICEIDTGIGTAYLDFTESGRWIVKLVNNSIRR